MVRNVLVVAATIFTLAPPAAATQGIGASTQVVDRHGIPTYASNERICVSVRHTLEKITVDSGGDQIEITLGGGACEPPGSGVSDPWARYSTNDSQLDVVEAGDCPAYQDQIDKLWSMKSQHPRGLTTAGNVRAGPYMIADWSDLFDLKSAKGRRAATRWISQTLAAVRPCWNTIREDRTRKVVDSLYNTLSMRLP